MNRANFVKYEVAREDGHRFYFRISYYGVGLFITSFFVFILLDSLKSYLPFITDIRSWMVDVIGPMLKVPARAGAQVNLWFICLLCVPLGRTTPYLFNKMGRKTALQALREAASKDALEELLVDSMENSKTIAITTTMRKVYVGSPLGTAEPSAARKSVAMLPLMSGYREESGEVHFTTHYDWAFSGKQSEDANNFRLVLPVDKIASASFFDIEVYVEFQSKPNILQKEPTSGEEIEYTGT